MESAELEHVNFTAPDPDAVAEELVALFGWHVRWAGAAIGNGRSVHVGTDDRYLAIYSGANPEEPAQSSYATRGGLNHIAVVVKDLDAVEAHVRDRGYTPRSHADYEPGRRFYFDGPAGVEFEVVSYA